MDKVTQLIKASTTIAESVIKLIDQQNTDSYKAVVVPKLGPVSIKSKTTSHDSAMLIVFYGEFMPIVKFAHDLSHCVRHMVYPHDEVMLHVDRSPSSVMKLESQLRKRAHEIQEYLNQIDQNIQLIIQTYAKLLKSKIGTASAEYLEQLYECMGHDFKFITCGVALMSQMFSDDMIDPSLHTVITRLSNDLKAKYIDSSDGAPSNNSMFKSESARMLQTLNLVPTTPNISLSDAFKRVTGVGAQTLTLDNLEANLKSVSKARSTPIAFVVMCRNNNDIYYDLTTLFDPKKLSKFSSKGGISSEYIDAYKVLRTTLIQKKLTSAVTIYNQPNRTQEFEAYILWTNDNKHFKLREQPVSTTLLGKILAGESSRVVDLYNKQFETIMLEEIANDTLVSYKQTKYLAFESENEEIEFIDKVCAKLVKHISSIKNIAKADDLPNQFHKLLQTEFNSFKPFHKRGNISSHALLVYNNAAARVATRLTKDLIVWSLNEQSIDEIPEMVRTVVASNDNIYTKFISSYYLSISGVDDI